MTFTTHNQVTLPAMMYGTAWKKDRTTTLVEQAVACGFTAIDTANQLIHYDEARVGEALLTLQKKGIQRENLFLQTKFTTVNGQGTTTPYDASANLTTQVNQSMDSSLKHLHTDYIDSYVLHGPHYRSGLSTQDWEVWHAIEALLEAGKTKIIGVSNFNAGQLNELLFKCRIKPMVVQNRCFAVTGWDDEVRQICSKEGIIYQGFSLLTANSRAVDSPQVQAIATRVGATVAQVIFRFAIALGMLPLTGTTSTKHMSEDLQSPALELSATEIELIQKIAL